MARLKLIEVRNVGTDNEMVFMRASEDLDLGNYIITDSTYRATGTISNKLRHVYEFPSHSVKKGELVALYSKVGKDHVGENTEKPPVRVHRFYWNLKERIWNQTGDRAYLLFAPRDDRASVVVPAVETKTK